MKDYTHKDNYDKAEDKGRQKALGLFGANLNIVVIKRKDAPADISGSTMTHDWYGELKDRKCKSTTYDSDVIEYSKWKNLQNIDKDALHYYINFFSDGVCRVYLLNEIKMHDLYVSTISAPISTVEDKGQKDKLMVELPISKAKVYRYNNDN